MQSSNDLLCRSFIGRDVVGTAGSGAGRRRRIVRQRTSRCDPADGRSQQHFVVNETSRLATTARLFLSRPSPAATFTNGWPGLQGRPQPLSRTGKLRINLSPLPPIPTLTSTNNASVRKLRQKRSGPLNNVKQTCKRI